MYEKISPPPFQLRETCGYRFRFVDFAEAVSPQADALGFDTHQFNLAANGASGPLWAGPTLSGER
jgi:hypothetical protein